MDLSALESADAASHSRPPIFFRSVSTGIAATHINGTTLHSHAGVGVPQRMGDFRKMHSEQSAKRWRTIDVLIVDEVSMVSAEFWSACERGVRAIRGSEAPWGGVQTVLCGDFCQLPPISTRTYAGQPADVFLNRGFCFQSPAWARAQSASSAQRPIVAPCGPLVA